MQTKQKEKCLLCQEDHFTSVCPTYTGSDKKSRLIQLKICFKCGRNYSYSHKCPQAYHCKHCKRDHRTDLCIENSNSPPVASPSQPKTNRGPSTQAASGSNNQQVHTVKPVEAKGSGVALATAQMKISYRGKVTSCRSFFDIGSQVSFVHPDVLNRLGLKYEPECSLTISPFVIDDDRESARIEGQYVKLGICLGKRKFNLRFFATYQTRMIAHCPGLHAAVTSLAKVGHKMADPQVGDEINDVELIIGADYLGKLVGRVK